MPVKYELTIEDHNNNIPNFENRFNANILTKARISMIQWETTASWTFILNHILYFGSFDDKF